MRKVLLFLLCAVPLHAQKITMGASPYTCDNAGFKQANNDSVTAGGGVIDAEVCGGAISFTSEEALGSSTSVVSVGLFAPMNGRWTWGLTDGTSCGFRLYPGAVWLGWGPGGSQGLKLQSTSSSTNMQGLLCIDGSTQSTVGGGYFSVTGVGVYAQAGTSFAKAPFWVYYAADGSRFTDVGVSSFVSGDAAFIQIACCGTTFFNLVVNGNNATGVLPLQIYDGVIHSGMTGGPINFIGGSIEFPGSGQHAIYQQGSVYERAVNYHGALVTAGADSTTSLIWVGSPYWLSSYDGITCHATNSSGTNFCFETQNSGTHLTVSNLSLDNTNSNNNAVKNTGGTNVVQKLVSWWSTDTPVN